MGEWSSLSFCFAERMLVKASQPLLRKCEGALRIRSGASSDGAALQPGRFAA
jgi:hypothetical protein